METLNETHIAIPDWFLTGLLIIMLLQYILKVIIGTLENKNKKLDKEIAELQKERAVLEKQRTEMEIEFKVNRVNLN